MSANLCQATRSARDFLPQTLTLPALRAASRNCEGCELHCNATQTVFGAGPSTAPIMLIGEQPGDQEDIQGLPFVGPAGRVLDQSLEQAGIHRDQTYVTNAVKHFRFELRGKKRLHQKPTAANITACRPWLEAEIEVIRPQIIVTLGATAAQSLLGSAFRLTKHRGEFFTDTHWAPYVLTTMHPSALLRIPDPVRRLRAMAEFLADMKLVAHQMVALERASQ